MNQNFLLIPFSPLINLFLIISFLLARKASCIDPQYLACNPKTCGDGQNISFPFYIEGQQESFCGYPGFNLFCLNNNPILRLQENNYTIQQIDYKNQILRVSNAAVFNTSNTCVPQFINTSLPNDWLRVSQNQTELFLLYQCNQTLLGNGGNSTELVKYKIDCVDDNSSKEIGPTLSIFKDDSLLRNALEVCEEELVVPVDLHRGEREINPRIGIERLLERGFVLNWTASNCSICENSGGKCGFNITDYHFRCFCPDRPHAWDCDPYPSSGNNKFRLKQGLAASAAAIGILIMAVWYFSRKFTSNNLIFCWKKKTKDSRSIDAFLKNHGPMPLKRYRYREVKKMTECFKDKLGQGGYGGVFKGMLHDGRFVAVKVLKESKSNGEEFVNEVASISRTSHVNVVTLLGFCYEGSKRALIYDFMSNGSLEKYIYDEKSPRANRELGWQTLYEIAIGVAQGLEYLHRGCNTRILHFDIKPHNILLDEKLCPKISDFGLAKICPTRESIISMMGARGTVGYIAPELFCRNFGGVSHKSDVYSYGMLVLEMIGGRRNICVEVDNTSEIYFPDWIYKRLEVGEELGLRGINNEEENQMARKMMLVSLWCIQTNPKNRPPMGRVIEMLQGSLVSLPIPPIPYLSSPSRSLPQPVENSSTTTSFIV